MNINLLITTVGRRSYIVNYFKQIKIRGVNLAIHACNNNPFITSKNYVDYFVISPDILSDEYIPFLMNYCTVNRITAILSLFDIDIVRISKFKKQFEEIGVTLLLSDFNVVNICHDKYATHEFLIKNKMNSPMTFLTKKSLLDAMCHNNLNFPIVIKPRWGFGSKAIYIANNENELNFYSELVKNVSSPFQFNEKSESESNVLFQEFLIGQEYNIDVLNGLDKTYFNSIVKIKKSMRSGETECAEIVTNNELIYLGEQLSISLKHVANLDVDLILRDGIPYVIDLNPRFGGGYPFSHLAGVQLPKALILWLSGKAVNFKLFEAKKIIGCKEIFITEV